VDGASTPVLLTGLQEIKDQIQQVQGGVGQLQNGLEAHITDWIHQMQSDHQPEVTIRQAGIANQVTDQVRQQIYSDSLQKREALIGISNNGEAITFDLSINNQA
jgi:X-X-X-Leu-X-X-Gly heptad repeat protein